MAFPMAFPAHHPTFCKVTTLARNMRNERPSSFMRPFLGDDLPKYLCMRDVWWMLMDTGNLAAKNICITSMAQDSLSAMIAACCSSRCSTR